MTDRAAEEGEEVVASGLALQQVSSWLGLDAAAVLEQETDPAIEAMFDKPHPSLLGLGAKYLSHKSMEASGLELKLKHKLHKSAGGDGDKQQYQPAQLERHQHKRRRHDEQLYQPGSKGHPRHLQQQQRQDAGDSSSSSSDSDEAGGKLGRLKHKAAAPPGRQQVLDRSQLLQVPAEHLSKWQRKRLREKAKKQQQQQGQ